MRCSHISRASKTSQIRTTRHQTRKSQAELESGWLHVQRRRFLSGMLTHVHTTDKTTLGLDRSPLPLSNLANPPANKSPFHSKLDCSTIRASFVDIDDSGALIMSELLHSHPWRSKRHSGDQERAEKICLSHSLSLSLSRTHKHSDRWTQNDTSGQALQRAQ